MPMSHRVFLQLARRRLAGKEGVARIREIRVLLAELPDYRNGPYADLRKWLQSEMVATRRRSSVVNRDSIAVRRQVVALDVLGDLSAMAATLPGITLIPGADGAASGISVLGLGADQNNITLNGLNFSGTDLPRDATANCGLSIILLSVVRPFAFSASFLIDHVTELNLNELLAVCGFFV